MDGFLHLLGVDYIKSYIINELRMIFFHAFFSPTEPAAFFLNIHVSNSAH